MFEFVPVFTTFASAGTGVFQDVFVNIQPEFQLGSLYSSTKRPSPGFDINDFCIDILHHKVYINLSSLSSRSFVSRSIPESTLFSFPSRYM